MSGNQQCDRCGHVAPLAELDMQYLYGLGVDIECRDGAACKARIAVRDWRPDIDAVVSALAALGITATAWPDQDYESEYSIGFEIDPKHYADSDVDLMHVDWCEELGWTLDESCHPGVGTSSYLGVASTDTPDVVAARIKALLDGDIDGLRPVPPYSERTRITD